jgi:hypothetical protein
MVYSTREALLQIIKLNTRQGPKVPTISWGSFRFIWYRISTLSYGPRVHDAEVCKLKLPV